MKEPGIPVGGRPQRGSERALLFLILLVAAFTRLWQLDSIPPGLTHDEANNVHDAASVLDGQRPVYFPVAQGKEPLYPYSVAASMALLGRSPWVMRLTSALWGLSLVALTFAWTRQVFGPSVALLTAAGLATGFWPVATSRLGLRAITLPVLFTAAVWLLCRGLRGSARGRADRPWLLYVLAGLALGASLYTYLAARVMPLVWILFFVYLSLLRPRELSRKVVPVGHNSEFRNQRIGRVGQGGVLMALLVATLVAAPLFLYLDAHPAAEIRVGQLDQPLQAMLDGDPGPLFHRVWETLGVFSFGGDTFIPYNLPGKPLLGPVMSVLFYAGLALALWRWRQPAYALALLWLIVGCAPALVTSVEAANLRAIAAQPVVYLFPALSLAALKGSLGRRSRSFAWSQRASGLVFAAGAALLFLAVAWLTYRDYFLRWADDRDVCVHYHAHLITIADYVREHPSEVFVISARYPGQYHDPRVVEAALNQNDRRLRWIDGRRGMVFPQEEDFALINPATMPLDPVLASLLPASEKENARSASHPNDAFDVYRWNLAPAPSAAPSIGTDDALAQAGDALLLLGADLSTPRTAAGSTVELLTTWQILARLPDDRDGVLFAQLLGPDGGVVAQEDRLDVPSWNWYPGDRFVQLFRIPLPAEMPAGTYELIVGVYTRPDRIDAVLAGHAPDPAMPRLPILIDGQVVGDFITLASLEVVAHD